VKNQEKYNRITVGMHSKVVVNKVYRRINDFLERGHPARIAIMASPLLVTGGYVNLRAGCPRSQKRQLP